MALTLPDRWLCHTIIINEVFSDYENKDAEYKAFCDDTSHSLKLIFCVDMLNEGLHLENISGVLLLRPTGSMLVYLQQIGRAIEANNTNTPVIIDAVNNFASIGQGMELLKEIKNAIAEEKESDPNFDDRGFEDIDTFFVLEQILSVKEMFAQIEERLEGSWDLYLKALRQFKEREGDCNVPERHVEIVDDVNVKLGLWCVRIRGAKKEKGKSLLTIERIKQLDEIGFIWDMNLYDWEKGLRHFDKYVREHDGDVLVPDKYVDEDGFPTGSWVSCRRKEFKNEKLNCARIYELNQRGFVWDVLKYRFENNVRDVAKYYEKYGKYPTLSSEDLKISKLGVFLNAEKVRMRDKNIIYPEWKKEIIDQYLPDFSCKTQREKSFDKFILYAKLYKERYGHLNIKTYDVIEGYNIGYKIVQLSGCKELSKHQLKELENLGVYLGNKFQKQFDKKMLLAKHAVKEGMVINTTNRKYKDEDLYVWIMRVVKMKYKKDKLSLEEIRVIEALVGKTMSDLYCGKKEPIKVKVVDMVENEEIGVFESLCETARIIQKRYNVKITGTTIRNRLNGKVTTPYKGRFMFYYADEPEQKEDNL